MENAEKKIIISSVILLIIFTIFAFATAPAPDPAYSTNGVVARVFVVALWLIFNLFMLHNSWHDDSGKQVAICFAIPMFLYMIFAVLAIIQSISENGITLQLISTPIMVLIPFGTYFFIAALSCGIWKSPSAIVLNLVIFIALQIAVDIAMTLGKMYGYTPHFSM